VTDKTKSLNRKSTRSDSRGGAEIAEKDPSYPSFLVLSYSAISASRESKANGRE